jgi:hypothetical protein
VLLSSSHPTTDIDRSIERGCTTTDKPFIIWTRRSLLDLVVESDICERELQLLGSKESARAVPVTGISTAFPSWLSPWEKDELQTIKETHTKDGDHAKMP